jgi:hypothetical protein
MRSPTHPWPVVEGVKRRLYKIKEFEKRSVFVSCARAIFCQL